MNRAKWSIQIVRLLHDAAIAVDRVVFWAGPTGRPIVVGWFRASRYDSPIFLCYLSVVPSLAIFLVSVETGFYDRYREYYGVATDHGPRRQVLEAERAMTACLRELAPRIAAGLGLDRLALTLLVGPRAYGLGYPLAALLGCAWAYRRLEETLVDLEYLTFAARPMVPEAPAVESSHPASA